MSGYRKISIFGSCNKIGEMINQNYSCSRDHNLYKRKLRKFPFGVEREFAMQVNNNIEFI